LLLAADGRLAEAQKELGAAKSMLGAVVRRDVRELQDLAATDPTARGDLGLLLWQNGRGDQARPHLAAALASLPSWSEVALAAGELALTSRDYAHAVELLSVASKCDAPNALAVNADAAAIVVGKSDDICARAKRDLALAYIGEAAGDLEQFARRAPDSSAIRQARSAVDRAQNDDRFDSVALFLRGSFDLLAGDEDDARSAFTRALSRGLPSAAEAAAKKYVAQIAENAEAARAPEPESEATSATPRRTVVVFLPDAAAETEKKLIETMSSFVSQLSSSSGVPLTVEFFRRADDAREFIAANRDRVGVVVTNPEFAGDFKAQFQFSREGSRNYRRVVVVPSESSIKSSSDLRGRTLSIAEGLRDTTGAGANVVRSTDDLAAIANVLTGKTDAALVSEVNPLIVQNARRLRIVSTSGATPLPVVAFAPMPQPDREALTNALRSMSGTRLLAPLMISGLAAIEREPRAVAKKIDVVALSPRELGIPNPPDPPANIALRAMVQLPVVALNEEMFDTP
jgi:ABC-type phosphate/phosphonate transport system substrate-binding protein